MSAIRIVLHLGYLADDEKAEALAYANAYIEQLEGEWVLARTQTTLPIRWNPIERHRAYTFFSVRWKSWDRADRFIRDLEKTIRTQLDVARQTFLIG